MAVDLHTRSSGSGFPVLLLHGLFGSGANLASLGRALRDGYEVIALDLPGHGRSKSLNPLDLPSLAEAVDDWLCAQDIKAVHVVGHSLGGKVAMQLALAGSPRISSLVVADIAPVVYPSGRHDAVFQALEAVASAGLQNRAAAVSLLKAQIEDLATADFLASNLVRDERGVYDWRFDWRSLQSAYDRLMEAPVMHAPWEGPTLFIKGGASAYILERHRDTIMAMFPAAQLRVMPDCGHWLHVEQPRLFNGIVTRFLASLADSGSALA